MNTSLNLKSAQNEGFRGDAKLLTRRDVQILLGPFLTDAQPLIEDFRIHYLDGRIDVEIILPFAAGDNPQQLVSIKNQCEHMRFEIEEIANVSVLLKI